MSAAERNRMLEAYHDGELSWLSRWRVRRLLARDPDAQAELEALSGLGGLLREIEAEAATPDLWESLRLRLPGLDARRAEAAAEPTRSPRWVGAGMAATAAALAVAIVLQLGPRTNPGAVRWLDSNGRPVLVLQDDRDATIIWLLETPAELTRRSGRALS